MFGTITRRIERQANFDHQPSTLNQVCCAQYLERWFGTLCETVTACCAGEQAREQISLGAVAVQKAN